MERFLAWAAAVSLAILPVLYPVMGLRAIIRGCNPSAGYWRRRLTLNLLETNLGMLLALGLAAAVAVLVQRGDALAQPLMAVSAAVVGIYTVAIVAFTPRDWWHALPAAIALACYATAWIVGG
jgi:hypothetical protein